ERLTVDACEDTRGRERHAPCRRVGELRERLGAEPIGEVLMKAETVRVCAVAVRPVGQPAVDAVERLESAGERRLADDRAEVARVQPAVSGNDTLLVRGEPFDVPLREEEIRKGDLHPSEDV